MVHFPCVPKPGALPADQRKGFLGAAPARMAQRSRLHGDGALFLLRPMAPIIEAAPMFIRFSADIAIAAGLYTITHILAWVASGRPDGVETTALGLLKSVRQKRPQQIAMTFKFWTASGSVINASAASARPPPGVHTAPLHDAARTAADRLSRPHRLSRNQMLLTLGENITRTCLLCSRRDSAEPAFSGS